jgi:S1-C subfamily serine protease
MLLRLTTTCLCAAGVFLLATLHPVRLEIVRPAPCLREPGGEMARSGLRRNPSPLSVVDVVDRMTPADLASLVALKPGERVTAVNDRPADSDVATEVVIASQGRHAGEYLDLTVASAMGERRVLLLLH